MKGLKITYNFDNAEFSIGNNGSNASFDGVIDEVRIWDTPKSVADLLAAMNAEIASTRAR